MLLKHPSDRIRSISQLKKFSSLNSLKMSSQVSKDSSPIRQSSLKKRNLEFVPFCQQRNIGKLITNKTKLTSSRLISASNNDLMDKLNFKNFKKLYNQQKKTEQIKYATQVRNSGQKNLIDQNQWIIKSVSKKSFSSLSCKQDGTNTLKLKHHSTHLEGQQNSLYLQSQNSQIKQRPNQTFHKIDLQLYKKIALNRPPNEQNPQLNNLFKHYFQACQLNQNERRLFLTKKAK